jgi:3-oxoacyl-ACP reductase-like protein
METQILGNFLTIYMRELIFIVRWEMESYGEFSMEGCIELAWMMGLIQYHKEANWSGWIDSQTKERLKDHTIKAKYEQTILQVREYLIDGIFISLQSY